MTFRPVAISAYSPPQTTPNKSNCRNVVASTPLHPFNRYASIIDQQLGREKHFIRLDANPASLGRPQLRQDIPGEKQQRISCIGVGIAARDERALELPRRLPSL